MAMSKPVVQKMAGRDVVVDGEPLVKSPSAFPNGVAVSGRVEHQEDGTVSPSLENHVQM